MAEVNIISLLSSDGYIMCNKTLIKLYGADAAIMVGELCAEYNYYKIIGELTPENKFYSTQENIEANTGLSPYYQRKAIKILQEAEIITVTKQGLPAKNYFYINENKLCTLFSTSREESEGLVVESLHINNNNNKNNNKKENTLSKDSVSQKTEFDFGISGETKKQKKKTNKSEYLDAKLLIDNFTNNTELKNKLNELLDNRIEISGKQKYHFYANTFKNYLEELSNLSPDVNIMIQSVKLSLQYNSTLKVMRPFSNNKTIQFNPDTNISSQKKFNPQTDTLSNKSY